MSSRYRVKRSASDYLSAASSVDSRADKVLQQLYRKIEDAIPSIEGDIAVANRNRAILGLANWLGSE